MGLAGSSGFRCRTRVIVGWAEWSESHHFPAIDDIRWWDSLHSADLLLHVLYPMSTHSTPEAPPATGRATRWLLVGIGVYSVLLLTALNLKVLSSGAVKDRAICDGRRPDFAVDRCRRFAHADPAEATGAAAGRGAHRVAAAIRAVFNEHGPDRRGHHNGHDQPGPGLGHDARGGPHYRIDQLLCRGPVFERRDLRADVRRLGVDAVVVISPYNVFLLFGITGSLGEGSINPISLFGGFWVFVYGLMVYLPACTVPADRGGEALACWWHYPMAIFLPLLAAIPWVPVVLLSRKLLGVQFLRAQCDERRRPIGVRLWTAGGYRSIRAWSWIGFSRYAPAAAIWAASSSS